MAVDHGLRADDVQGAAHGDRLGRDLDRIAGAHHVLEADLVQTGVERRVALELFAQDQGAGLRHDLTEDDAGHHRESREVALDEELFARHMVGGPDAFGIAFRPVHEQHRLAVREQLFDFFSIHYQ